MNHEYTEYSTNDELLSLLKQITEISLIQVGSEIDNAGIGYDMLQRLIETAHGLINLIKLEAEDNQDKSTET